MKLGIARSHPLFAPVLVLVLAVAVFAMVTHLKIDQFRYASADSCRPAAGKMTESREEIAWDAGPTISEPMAPVFKPKCPVPERPDNEPLLPASFHRQRPFAFRPPPAIFRLG